MTFEGSGDYVLGDNDTITEAKKFAFQEAKRMVLEKMGTYLQSKTEMKDFSVTKDEIIVYSQGSIKVKKVDEERFSVGERSLGVRIKILAEADSKEILNKLDILSKQDRTKDEIAQLKMEYDTLKKEIAKINMDLKKEKDENIISFLRDERKEIFQKIENREKGISILTSGKVLFAEALLEKQKIDEVIPALNQFLKDIARAYKITAENPKSEYNVNGTANIIIKGNISLPGKYGSGPTACKENEIAVKNFRKVTDLNLQFCGPNERNFPKKYSYLSFGGQHQNRVSLMAAEYLKRNLGHIRIMVTAGEFKDSRAINQLNLQGRDIIIRDGWDGVMVTREFEFKLTNLPFNKVKNISKVNIEIVYNPKM